MKAFFAAFLAALLVGGCAHVNPLARPGGASQKQESHSRLRVSENTDLFGV